MICRSRSRRDESRAVRVAFINSNALYLTSSSALVGQALMVRVRLLSQFPKQRPRFLNVAGLSARLLHVEPRDEQGARGIHAAAPGHRPRQTGGGAQSIAAAPMTSASSIAARKSHSALAWHWGPPGALI